MKYEMIDEIKSVIKDTYDYADDTYVTSHLLGIALAYLTTEQVKHILDTTIRDREILNQEIDLAYERSVGK